MNGDQERITAEAFAAADRVLRYRRLRTVTVIIAFALVAIAALGFIRTSETNRELCERSAENRAAAIDLAHLALAPLPTTGVSDELARLSVEANTTRAERLARFLHVYQPIAC